MPRSIVVMIGTDGETKVEAVGHSGGSCVKAMSPLTKTLIGGKPQTVSCVKAMSPLTKTLIGGKPQTVITKPEFYAPEMPVRLRETE